MQRKVKRIGIFIGFILIFCLTSCASRTNNQDANLTTDRVNEPTAVQTTLLGQGNTKIFVTVVDEENSEVYFEVCTDKETVGEALTEVTLIAGEQGPYGLNVKTVNGITLDYDKDGQYWAFYINGEYALTGVDATKVVEGEHYMFKVTKG